MQVLWAPGLVPPQSLAGVTVTRHLWDSEVLFVHIHHRDNGEQCLASQTLPVTALRQQVLTGALPPHLAVTVKRRRFWAPSATSVNLRVALGTPSAGAEKENSSCRHTLTTKTIPPPENFRERYSQCPGTPPPTE